jgi:hypothetical protein
MKTKMKYNTGNRILDRGILLIALTACACLSLSACSKGKAETGPAEPVRKVQYPLEVKWTPPELDTSDWALEGTHFGSEKEAIEGLLRILEKRSEKELVAFCFNKREYTNYMYPYDPVSMPVRNASADFVWSMHWLRAGAGLRQSLSTWGGKRLTYIGHRFTKDSKMFGPLTLHRDVEVTVKDESGEEMVIQPFRSLIELGGRFKVFSFVR